MKDKLTKRIDVIFIFVINAYVGAVSTKPIYVNILAGLLLSAIYLCAVLYKEKRWKKFIAKTVNIIGTIIQKH